MTELIPSVSRINKYKQAQLPIKIKRFSNGFIKQNYAVFKGHIPPPQEKVIKKLKIKELVKIDQAPVNNKWRIMILISHKTEFRRPKGTDPERHFNPLLTGAFFAET